MRRITRLGPAIVCVHVSVCVSECVSVCLCVCVCVCSTTTWSVLDSTLGLLACSPCILEVSRKN